MTKRHLFISICLCFFLVEIHASTLAELNYSSELTHLEKAKAISIAFTIEAENTPQIIEDYNLLQNALCDNYTIHDVLNAPESTRTHFTMAIKQGIIPAHFTCDSFYNYDFDLLKFNDKNGSIVELTKREYPLEKSKIPDQDMPSEIHEHHLEGLLSFEYEDKKLQSILLHSISQITADDSILPKDKSIFITALFAREVYKSIPDKSKAYYQAVDLGIIPMYATPSTFNDRMLDQYLKIKKANKLNGNEIKETLNKPSFWEKASHSISDFIDGVVFLCPPMAIIFGDRGLH